MVDIAVCDTTFSDNNNENMVGITCLLIWCPKKMHILSRTFWKLN